MGPFVVAAQEPRRSLGVVEAIQAGLRAQQVVGLWPQCENSLVATFTLQVAARLFDVPAAQRLAPRISHVTISRGPAPIHLFNIYSTVGGGRAAANHCVILIMAALEAAATIGQQP